MNAKILAFGCFLLGGAIISTPIAISFQRKLDEAKTANKKQLRDVALDEATRLLTAAGCSNFSFMVVGEYEGSQRAALIQSNRVYFDVTVKMKSETNSAEQVISRRLL